MSSCKWLAGLYIVDEATCNFLPSEALIGNRGRVNICFIRILSVFRKAKLDKNIVPKIKVANQLDSNW